MGKFKLYFTYTFKRKYIWQIWAIHPNLLHVLKERYFSKFNHVTNFWEKINVPFFQVLILLRINTM